jgi:predicted nuclease of predicted toxin-antitoxin system
MKFLVDRCAGTTLAGWLKAEGHDVVEVAALGVDPGDEALLALAAGDGRVLVTIDTDFGKLVYRHARRLRRVQREPLRPRADLFDGPRRRDAGSTGPRHH